MKSYGGNDGFSYNKKKKKKNDGFSYPYACGSAS
jgi:hypothetical protein